MARPRFPGRPGCRYERILVRYIEEESRTQIDPNFGLVLSFCCGLKQFREIVGESDEDEEFEGFTQQEVRASARKYVAMLSSSKNEQDSPESSSSSSSSSLPSVARHRISGTSQTRRQKVRATMASTPYIKKGLGKKSRSHFYMGRTVQNVYTMPKEVATAKLKNIKIRMEPDGKQAKIVRGRGRPSLYVHSAKKQVSVRSPNSENEKSSHKKVLSFGRGRKRSIVSRSRSKRLGTEFAKHLLLRARKGHDSISSSKDCLLDSDSTPGYQRKHFIMPTKSSRSSRVIKPNKRFLEDSGYHIMFSKSQTTDSVSVNKGANEGVTDGVVTPQLEHDKEFSKIKKQQPTKVLQPLSPLPLPPKIKRGRGRPRLYKPPLPTLDSTLEGSVKLNKKNMQTKSQDLGLESEEILKSGHKSLPVSDQAESRIQRRIGLPVEPSSQSCSRTVTSETFCLRKTSKRGRKSSLSLKSHCVGTSRSLLQSDHETLRKTRQRGYSVRSKLEEGLSFQSAKIPEAMTLKSESIHATDNMPANSEANLESKLLNPACPPAASSVRTPVSGRHIIVTDESSKTGLFDQPLVVEGKRQRKPSFRMRLKQSEEILNYKELKRLEVHRLIEDETEANEDTIDIKKDALEKDKTDFSKNLKVEVEEKPCLPSIDQSLPTLPTSPFRPKLELFSPCGSGGSFISPTEKQKLEELDREMADATRRSGNNILRKAKFQLNRAALNRSKAALARSLKAKMRHEAKLEKKRQREVEKQKQTATTRSPLALSSLSVVAKGLTDVHGSLKRSLIKTEGGVTSPAVSPGSTVVTPVATTVTPGSTLTLGQSRQNDGDSSLQPTAKIPLKRSRKMCAVCGNKIGVVSFYGVPCCIGCRKFYMLNRKRKKIPYHCKKAGCCTITRLTKSQCNACRLRRCQELFSSDSNISAASSISKLSSRSAYKLSLNTTTKNLARAHKKAETETQRVPATASMETASVAATDTELTSPNGKTPGSNRKGRRSRDTSDEDPSKEESFRVGGCGSVTSSSSVMTSVGRKMSNVATTTSRSLPRQTTSIMKHRRRRKVRCKQCEGCLADDCGVCVYCLDKPKFGGKNVIKQACINRRCHFPSYTNCATNSFILPKKSGDPDEEDADSYPNTPNSHRDRRRRACVEQLGGRPSPGHQPKLGKPNVKLKRPHLFQQFKKRNKEKAVTLCGKSTDSVNMFVQAPTSFWGTAEGCLRSKSSGPLAVRKWTNQDYLCSPAAHRIKVDYKEDCDLCRVWEQGLAILVSAPLCMRTMCYLCGSTGQHDFVYCYMCCEPFHLFCLDEDTRPTEKNQESWCCLRCQYCQVCGKQDNLLQCNKCQDTYHPECLGPNYPTKPSKKKKIWVCTKCVRCKSCGATTPGISGNATWMHDFSLCYECGKLMDRGNFCPICRKCYTDDDWDSKMVQCSTCESWVHATCGGLTDELYQMFSHLPEDVPYICLVCSEESPASWECVIKSTRQHGFTCVMKALQNSKCAQHLMGQHFLKCLAEKKKNRIKSCKPALLTSIDCHDSSPDGSQEVTSGISTTASGTVSPSTRTSPASICHNNNPLAFNRSLKDSSPDTGLIVPQSSVATVITVSTSCTTSCTTSATCFKTLNFRTSDCDKSTACGRMATSCAKMKPRTYSRVPHICDSSRSQYNETLQNSVRSYSNPKKCLHDHKKRTVQSVPTLPSAQLSSSSPPSSVCTPITIPSNTSPHMSISTTTASLPSTVSQTHSTPAYSYSPSPTCKSVTSSSSLTSPSPLTNTSVPSCSTSSTSSSLSVTSSQSVSLHSPISNSVSLSPVVPKPTPFIIPSFTKSVGSTAVARLSTSSTTCVGDSLSSKTTAASPNKGGGACRFVMGPMPHFGFFRRNTSSRSLGISIVSSTASNSISKVAAIAAATSNTISNNQTITTSTTTSTSSGSLTNTSSQTSYSPTSLTTSTSIAIPPRSAVNFHASVSSSQTIGNLSIPATIPTLCVKPTTTFDSSKKLTKSSSYAKDGSTIITVTPVGHVSSNLPVRSSATIINKEAFPGRDEVCNQFRDSISSPTLKTAPFTTTPPLPLLATSNASSPITCDTNLAKKPSDLKTNLLANCSVNRTFKNEQTKGNPLKGSYKVSKLNTIKEEVEEKEVSVGTSGRVNCDNSLGKSTSSEINNSVALITCKSEPLDTFETCVTASAHNQATKRRSKKPSLSTNVTTEDNYEELGNDDDDDDDDPSATDTASEDLTESEKPKYSEVRACLRKERLRIFARARKNGTLIDLGNGNISRPEKKKKLFRKKHIKHPKYFETVIYKVNNSLYNSVQQFTEDIVRIIQSAVNNPKGQTVSRKRANHSVRSIFIKQMEKYFPWFNVKTCVLWDHHRNLPAGMLPNGVLPPFSDHNYAQWMKDVSEPLSSTAAPHWKLSTHVKSDSKAGISSKSEIVEANNKNHRTELAQFYEDTRTCVLCWKASDLQPEEEGRLIYVGQDDWVHVNCALWSAEAFEDEMDGTLQNVQTAINRGKMMRCDKCSRSGATVGCCHRGCPANFHFLCAKEESCVFQEDKKVYCYNHRHKVDGNLVEDNDFDVIRRVCIYMDPQKYPKKSWVKGLLAPSINIVIGSCTIENLGSLTALSDTWDMLLPIGFRSSRVYWSTKHVNSRCVYTCRIIAVKPQCQKVSSDLTSDQQLTIEHNTTKIEDPVLANASMATFTSTTENTATENVSKNALSAFDTDKLDSMKATLVEAKPKERCSITDVGNNSSAYTTVEQQPMADKCQQLSLPEESESHVGSKEPSASDSLEKSNESSTKEIDGAILDVINPLSPSTQAALETLQDTSNRVFAGDAEKKWLESLPENMEAIVVVTEGEELTDEEAVQLATEALQAAEKNAELGELDSSEKSVEDVPILESTLTPDVEEVISVEECSTVIDTNCNSMTLGKKTLPDNFHETSLYDVTEAQVLTEGNKEVMYLGVENKPVEVISLNRRSISMNYRNKNKCSRLPTRLRDTKSSSTFSPIYGSDGQIIGHKLSITDALSLKTSPQKMKRNDYHERTENQRARRINSKNSPMRYQTSRKPNSSPKSTGINRMTPNIEDKIRTSANVADRLTEVKCKVTNGEKWENMVDSPHLDSCRETTEEGKRTEIKEEVDTLSALLTDDKTWSDSSLEFVKNQERNKNSPPVKVYPLRQTVSRMCEQALAKRPLEAISRSCGDDRTKSMLVSQSSTEPQTMTTMCDDSVSIKKIVEDTIPLHDQIALKIKAESLAKSSPGERGPFKCPTCKRLYRTRESFETHVEQCDFELSTSEEDDDEQDSLRSPRRYLGNPRYPMRSTTLIQRVAAEVEAEMNLIKKFCPRKRSHDSVSSADTGVIDPFGSRGKQVRQDRPISRTTVDNLAIDCNLQNHPLESKSTLGCDDNACNANYVAAKSMLTSEVSNTEENKTKNCRIKERQQQDKKQLNSNENDFDSDATLSPAPYDNFLEKNHQSDEESNNSMLCPRTGFTISAGTNRNNLDLLSELATKLSKPEPSNSEKVGHLIGLRSTGPRLPSDIALAKKMSVVEVPGGLYKQKFEVINGKFGKVFSSKESAIVSDFSIVPNHSEKSTMSSAKHHNYLAKTSTSFSKGSIYSSTLSEGASTCGPSENQNKSGHQGLFERIFHSIDVTNTSNSLPNVLENPLSTTSHMSSYNIDSESNVKMNAVTKDGQIGVGCGISRSSTVNNCLITKSVSKSAKKAYLPAIHTSSVSQSLTSTTTSSLAINSDHACEANSNQAVPVKCVEAKPSQQPLFVGPSTMTSQVLTTPMVTMGLCNTVCSLPSQTCMVAPSQQLSVPMQSASPHVLGLATTNEPLFQSQVLSSPALPQLATSTAFATGAVTPVTLTQPSKCQPSQPQPTLNINYVGSFVLPTPADQLVTISQSIASIPLSSIATSVPHLQVANSIASVVTSAKLQSPSIAIPHQQNSVMLPDGSIQTLQKTSVSTMQTPNSIVKILVDNSSTQFVTSANIDTSPQPQGSIYNYGKLLQEIFKANQTPPALTTPTDLTTSPVNSNQLANERKPNNPVNSITTTTTITTTTIMTTKSSNSGGYTVVSKNVPMRRLISHTSHSKSDFQPPGFLRRQNDTDQLKDSCDPTEILSGVKEGSKFIKNVVDSSSKQDLQIPNSKSYMPPVKKSRLNLCTQPSDVQPTKQIISYLSNKNGLTTSEFPRNLSSSDVCRPKLVKKLLEVNQNTSNSAVLKNTTNQLSVTSPEHQESQQTPDGKIVYKATTPRSRRKPKPLGRRSRLDMKGICPESYVKNGCSSRQMLQNEGNVQEEEQMPFMSLQSRASVPPNKTVKPDPTKPHIMFEISSEDGFYCRAYSMEDAWQQVFDAVQELRAVAKIKQLPYANVNGTLMFGVSHHSVVYLLEQLHGARNCNNYKFNYHSHQRERDYDDQELAVNPSGCIRTEPFSTRKPYDMFSFLMSRYRKRPQSNTATGDEEMALKSSRRPTSMDLPMAMRFRHLEAHAREAVGVYRSLIHGRGLFCKRNIDAGEMVIEYAGEVVRAELTDKREKFYESKGIGCYMFRMDDIEVVDATMHGNAARFINHSCDPNCYSKVIQVDGKKHIVIFAMRPIKRGEELTYDYKFPIEEIKIPCTCGSRRCRKYLN